MLLQRLQSRGKGAGESRSVGDDESCAWGLTLRYWAMASALGSGGGGAELELASVDIEANNRVWDEGRLASRAGLTRPRFTGAPCTNLSPNSAPIIFPFL